MNYYIEQFINLFNSVDDEFIKNSDTFRFMVMLRRELEGLGYTRDYANGIVTEMNVELSGIDATDEELQELAESCANAMHRIVRVCRQEMIPPDTYLKAFEIKVS